jgi:hypothetical protein
LCRLRAVDKELYFRAKEQLQKSIYNGQQREGTSNKHRLFTVGSVTGAMATCLQVGNLNCLGVLFNNASPYTEIFVSYFNACKAAGKLQIYYNR